MYALSVKNGPATHPGLIAFYHPNHIYITELLTSEGFLPGERIL